MIEKFSQIAPEDSPGEWSAIRAVQCWQILVSKASTSSILTYGELADLMGIHWRSLNPILGYIWYYCEQNSLPHLTSIVVRQDTGLPGVGFSNDLTGEGFSTEEIASIPAKHISVFYRDWFDIRPPSVDEFIEAYKAYSV